MLKKEYTFTNFHSLSRLSNHLLTNEDEGSMFFQILGYDYPTMQLHIPKQLTPSIYSSLPYNMQSSTISCIITRQIMG
jgi:hypothetical protein